ncbi:MAG TPA: YncE family protein, partial [Crenalkalicoccus sp.]|nr:YncE family protein [Crenalkalicoccus sp.]
MHRALALALLLALAAPARADLLYVLNSGEASISLVDPATPEELRRIPVLREPHHLTLTPDGTSLVVADAVANELLFLDPATAALQRRLPVSNPYHLAYSPDGRVLVIASLRRDQVDLYDAEGPHLLARHRLPDMPSHIAFRPDSTVAYVTLQGNRRVAAISLATREVLWQAEVGPEPAGILWHEGRLLVGAMGADYFAVLNPETRQVERRITVGRGAHTAFRGPDGTLWLTSRLDSRVTALDPATLIPRRVYDIPGGPDDLVFDPAGRIWMTLRWIARVARLDPVTGAVEEVR